MDTNASFAGQREQRKHNTEDLVKHKISAHLHKILKQMG